MTKFSIVLSTNTVNSLVGVVEDFNAQTGQELSLEEWMILYLKQKAIEKDISSDAESIKKELDAEFPRRIAARRRELLDALG